jgi:hypothetical protein
MAGGLLEVWQFDRTRFEHATAKDLVIQLSDTTALYMQSGNGTLDLVPDRGRYSNPSSHSLSVRCHIALHEFVA